MTTEELKKLEATLWQTADTLRANSDLKSSEYSTPVLGLIFLAIRPTMVEHGNEGWIAICFAGVLVALPGLALMLVHDRNRKRRRAAQSGIRKD